MLVGGGITTSGYSQDSEVIDLDDPGSSGLVLPLLNEPLLVEAAGLMGDEVPIICGKFNYGTNEPLALNKHIVS